jgi:RimJ/RimL family protein N-acetyltransferase
MGEPACRMNEAWVDGTWLTAGPPEVLDADRLTLRRWSASDHEAMYAAVTASQEHLAPWMPWARDYDREGSQAFLAGMRLSWEQRTDFGWGIWDDDTLVGAVGLHNRVGAGILEIGYWSHVDHAGRGIARRAAAAVTRAGCELPGTSSLEIRTADTNTRSARIPEALGYRRHREVPRAPEEGGGTDVTIVWVLDVREAQRS